MEKPAKIEEPRRMEEPPQRKGEAINSAVKKLLETETARNCNGLLDGRDVFGNLPMG